MIGTLTGKVAAIVTGASRGIGRATAERLAKDGATVVVNYATSAQEADAVVERIKTQGGKALAIQADIAKLEDIHRLFRDSFERLDRLDIFVANAGYSCFKPMEEITEEDFNLTYRLNAKGTYFCLQEALRRMTDGGRVVCISTIGTVLNVPGGTCYFGSKAAVEQHAGERNCTARHHGQCVIIEAGRHFGNVGAGVLGRGVSGSLV